MRSLILVLGMAILSCSPGAPPEPLAALSVQLDDVFTLRPGQEADVAGASIRIRFLDVGLDSRCPVDVQCVWAGDALVHLVVRRANGADEVMELHTHLEPRSALIGEYRVTVVDLKPEPHSARSIPQEEYEVQLRVSREP